MTIHEIKNIHLKRLAIITFWITTLFFIPLFAYQGIKDFYRQIWHTTKLSWKKQ